ncbi:3'-5' exonuclease [Streptosporangium sp. NBC_01755]|uniref:3'-5' exonuclease n=1 Tax=unclassified Streptosporangium TaxID=2632669 RepID=UPI002DD9E8C7|nr:MULTISPECIES: 3'-5' exonuclease [unclassified Streptosporangium]WSA25615.1 3'-5' exonuclease [Streptosporangium sp. NBC_01810]WSD02997.1 3'-5' exonuclease [Streptosporangium sp. NBC_01755]
MTSSGLEPARNAHVSTRQGYVVVDVETTGFSPSRGDRICEIALISLNAQGETVDEWHSLVNPRRGTGAVHVHGITGAMVAGAPMIEELLDEVWQRIAGRVLVAHNAPFDLRFLQRLPGSEWVTETLCTQRLAPGFIPDGRWTLAACCERAGIPLLGAHAALADARATAELLRFYLRTGVSWAEKLEQAAQAPEWRPCGMPQRHPRRR